MKTRYFQIASLAVALAMLLAPLAASVSAASGPAAPVEMPTDQDTPEIEVEAALRDQLAADETTGYLIYFEAEPDLSPAYEMDWIERGRFVANALNQAALRSQTNVRAYLDAQGIEYKAFWIDNVISVESSNRATFDGLLTYPEIKAIRQHRQLGLIEPEQTTMVPSAPQAVEPNIAHVLVDQVWALGYTGEGIVVASVDTGVRYTHDALVDHYRGNLGGGAFDHNYNWWDPYGDHPTEPGDDNGHGSHTMGTMVGDDGGANQIGMAPGAQWMACRGCDTSSCGDTELLECAQFFAAPWDLTQSNANPDMRPNAVNNSWGDCEQSYDDWYQDVVDAWHAAGIYPIFSNGNASNCGYPTPPGLNTVGNPARYGNVTGVGSTGRDNGQYAPHSNWGPTDNPDTVNPHPGWEDLKPQVLAPGVNIRSSVNTGDSAYEGGWGGTSMSAPHVTGLIALMWSAAPCLVGDYARTETILEDTATPIAYDDGTGGGAHVPNYAAGWGEINALAAVQAAAAECGDSAIVGQVTDATTSAPVAGAAVLATSATEQRQATSGADGFYAMTVFSDTYTLQASRYGYQTAVVPDVVATTGATTTQDIALTPATLYEVSGQVTDAATGWPLYADISISGDPVDPIAPGDSVWTNPATGEYSIMLAEGVTYTFEVEAWVAGYDVVTGVVGPLTQDETANFALQADMDSCTAPGYYFTGGLMAGFEDDVFPPAGWTVVNNGGACEWVGDDPGGRGNLTGGTGKFAVADSDACGVGTTMDTDLVSPPSDVSDLSVVNLSFAYDYNFYSSGEQAAVDVSADNGATWVNVVTWTSDQRGPATFSQDVTAILGGSTQARVRFHYYGSYDWWWEVDDVVLGNPVCQTPPAGGLVVGNVYDANYPTAALNGATVINAASGETTAVATPDDAAVDDAFYTLFAPSGAQAFTATMTGGYGPDAATVTVVDGDTVKQDFQLPAGLLDATPDGIDVTVALGYTDTATLNLANAGGVGAAFEIGEKETGFAPLGPFEKAAFLVKSFEQSYNPTAPKDNPLPSEAQPYAAGDVIRTWPSGRAAAWGIAYDGMDETVWIGDGWGAEDAIFEYAPDGTPTGVSHDYTWNPTNGPADAAFNWNTGMLWMMDVTGDDCIHEIDPATGVTGDIICPGFGVSQRGLAYDPTTDTYFAGSWNDQMIHRFDADGNMLADVNVGLNISGLAYNPDTQHLFVQTNSGANDAYVLDVANNYALIGQFHIGALVAGAGLEIGCDGSLWAVDQNNELVYQVESGEEISVCGQDVPWLFESPTAGTVAAMDDETVAVTFDAAYVDQPGEYHADLVVKNDTPYGKFSVPVTMTVTPPHSWGKLTGVVTGLGVCDENPAPLEEAELFIESSDGAEWWMTTTDVSGIYQIWLDAGYSPLTVTVTAPDYYGVAAGVMVTQGETTVLDFDLRLLQPCLSYDPAALETTLEIGNSATEPFTLTNTGAGDADFELIELAGGFLPLAPALELNIPTNKGDSSLTGASPASLQQFAEHSVTQDGAVESPSAPTQAILLDQPPNQSDGIFSDANCDNCTGGVQVAAENFALSTRETVGQIVFWTGYYPGDVPVDPDAITVIFHADAGGSPGTMLSVETDVPYDRVQTGVILFGVHEWQHTLTLANPVTLEPGNYWVEIYNDTGGGTDDFFWEVGDLDPVNGLVGSAWATTAPGSGWNYDGATEMAIQLIAAGGGIPWLSEDPVTGTVAADSDLWVDITFDASIPETMQPGEYYGQLMIDSNAPNTVTNVPVTLTVTAPDTWGKIAGVVTGLGYCDSDPAPLEGAEVTVEAATGMNWLVTTDVSGTYRLWLDEAHSPLTLTFEYPDHVTEVVTDVMVVGQGTTVVDAALRWAQPCLTVDPDLFDVTVELGMSTTLPFSLTNWGAAAASFDLVETNGGFTIMASSALPTTIPAVVGASNPAWAESGEAVGEPVVGAPAGGAAPKDIGLAWETMALLPSARVFNAVIADTNGYVYVIGGTSDAGGSTPTNTTYRYDTATDSWDTMATMPAALMSIDGAVINGKIYIPGDATTTNTFVYDIATNTWSTLATTGGYTAREQYQVVAIGTDLYVLGGIVASASASTTEVWILDTTTGAWTVGVPMQKSRTSFSAGAINGEIYVAGGVLFPGFTPDMTAEKFDGTSWSYIANVPDGGGAYTRWSYNADGVGVDGLWLAAGRRDAGWAVLDHAGYYDPGTDTWTDSPTIPTLTQGRVYMEGDVASDGYFYVIGGRDSSGAVIYATNERLEVGYAGAGGDIPWLSEDPISGTVAADSTFDLDLTFDASVPEVTQPGEYFGTLYTNSDDPYNGMIPVPVTMTVEPPATWGKLMGAVTSLGYCDADPTPLVGANLLITGTGGMTWTVTTDVSGTYQLWLDEAASPITITAQAPEHETVEVFGVTVAGGVTTTQDFDLRWLEPCVNADPSALHATLELGATVTEALTLTNTGAVDTDWRLTEENLGAPTVTPPGVITLLTEAFEGAFPPAGWTRVENIGSCNWESSATTGYTNQTGGAGNFADANSDWCGTGMDTELWTPSFDFSAAAAPMLSFQSDYRDLGDDAYVDVSTDGGTTWTNLLHYDGVSMRGPRLVQLDLSAYAGQPNIIIRFHYVAPGWDWYWQVDDVQVSYVDQVIWLAETPAFGNLAADTGLQAVDVGFDASVVDQPGEYYANLWANSDDPTAPIILPVTMTVTPPASWGRLMGTVSSLGHCDANPVPLAGATVVISDGMLVTLTTDVSGTYSYWLPNGAYTVTVSADDHVSQTLGVSVGAASTTTQDFDLTWLGPCVDIEAVTYDLTLPMGMSGTLPLTLTNFGAGEATFELSDQAVGFIVAGPTHAMPATAPLPDIVATGDQAFSVNPNPPVQGSNPQPAAPRAPDAVQILTHSLSQVILAGSSVSCNAAGSHADNSYLRVFDLAAFGVVGDFTVTNVEVGIETAAGAGGTQPVEVRLYTLAGPLLWSNMTLIGSASVSISDQALSHFSVPVSGVAPAGSILVVEFFTPNGQAAGHSLFVGSNNLGQTAPTYLAAAACSVVEPTDTAAIGYPGMHLVMNVTGETAEDALWLFEDPITGTIPAGGGQVVADITLDSAYVWMPGEYHAMLSVNTDDEELDTVSYPVTMTVTLTDTYGYLDGTAYSRGYCDAEMNSLEGAEVLVESAAGSSWMVTTDVSGTFDLWLDEAGSPYTVTAMADEHETAMLSGVLITGTETTTLDIELTWLRPCVSVAPEAIHEVVTMGMSTTVPMTIGNTGAFTLSWSLAEEGRGFQVMAPSAGEDVLVVRYDTTAATAMETALTNLGYTYLGVDRTTFQTMALADLLEYKAVFYAGSSSGDSWAQAMAYLDAGGSLYISDNDLGYYNNSTTFYQTYLQASYVSDDPGINTLIGEDIMAGLTVDISADPYPDDFAVGAEGTRVFQFLGGNAAGVKVARNGYKAIYTSFDFDDVASAADEEAIIQRAMGFLAPDVPWLFEDPVVGETAPTGASPVTITLDASVPEVTQPGDYYAALNLQSDDPVNDEIGLPVTMTVLAPATWGKLAGVVTGLGYCDADPSALEGAEVLVESTVTTDTWTLTTDVSGTYGVWLDEMYNPLTVTVSYPDHESQMVTGVPVTATETTVVDLNLHWLQPCVSMSCDSLEITLAQGETANIAMDVLNAGALHSWFGGMEWNIGFEPLAPLAAGGPDGFGYQYADSDEGVGPVYDFVDISDFGVPLALQDNEYAEIDIGFDFAFYGADRTHPNVYDTLFVGSNGFLSFGSGSTALSNQKPLPDPTLPNNLIAAMWDDLAPGAAGMVSYQSFGACPYNPWAGTTDACLIVQYDGYEHAGDGMAGTFEVILFRTGSILMQFAEADAPGATTGIENALGLVGLSYGPALADELAICFAYPGQPLDCQSTDIPWLAMEPEDGSVDAHSTAPMTVTFDAGVPEVEEPGVYMAELWVQSHDPITPFHVMPVTMTVTQFGGRLAGTVTCWSYCNATSETLEGVELWIEGYSGAVWQVETDTDGDYQIWLDEGDNPYTIMVAHGGYAAQTLTNVDVTNAATTQFDLDLRVDQPCFSVAPGTYDVIVAQGHMHTETLDLVNAGAGLLEYYDLDVTVEWLHGAPATGTVAADSTGAAVLTFDATGMALGPYAGILEVTHNDAGAGRTFVRPIDMLVVGYMPTLDPITDTATGDPGATIVYSLMLTNDGTYTDTFDVAVSGGVWTATVPSAVGPLGVGASTALNVSVDIPATAQEGYSDTVTVTVTSQGDDWQTADAMLTTTAMISEVRVFLPLVLRNF